MMLHPGIIAMIVGTAIVLLLMLRAAALGVRILRRWDFTSSSESQLDLERRTYLVSTIVSYALGFEIVSSLLFMYTVDSIHPLFVGAMCATGTLNANPVGWYAFGLKIVVFFAAALWIAVNYCDQRAGDFPLIIGKYRFLLVLTPLVGLDLVLQLWYFLGLEPEVITSCCGALFSAGGSGVAAELAGLPLGTSMTLFFVLLAGFAVAGAACLFSRRAVFRYGLFFIAGGTFLMSLAGIVSFLSLYIYEIPTHHCPFDIFQKEYGFIGYPLYAGLFGGTYFGLLPGFFMPLKRRPSLAPLIERAEKKWVGTSLLFMGGFAALSLWKILGGSFTLRGSF